MLPERDKLTWSTIVASMEARERERERMRRELEELRYKAEETLVESQTLLDLADKILSRR